jgi:hypothetical protein
MIVEEFINGSLVFLLAEDKCQLSRLCGDYLDGLINVSFVHISFLFLEFHLDVFYQAELACRLNLYCALKLPAFVMDISLTPLSVMPFFRFQIVD